MAQFFLHIGLHKTGTTTLQKYILPNIDDSTINYNPSELFKLLHKLQYRYEMAEDVKINIVDKAKNWVNNYNKKEKILISNENLSQLGFLQNYEESATILKDIFPNANILLVLRYQPSWLISCYKQSLKMGDWQSIEDFLQFRNGKFNNIEGFYNSNDLLHMNVHKADWTNLISIYKKLFKNVNILFHENFVSNPSNFVQDFTDIINIKKPSGLNYAKKYNKSMSNSEVLLKSNLSYMLNTVGPPYFLTYKQKRFIHYNLFYNNNISTNNRNTLQRYRNINNYTLNLIDKLIKYLPASNKSKIISQSTSNALHNMFKTSNKNIPFYQ